MAKKDEFVTVFGVRLPKWKDCSKCGKKLACKMGTYGYEPLCSVCLGKKLRDERKAQKTLNGIVGAMKGYKDITAIGIDRRTGQQVGISEDGKRIPLDKTRYDLHNDPHGWKVTGKKVRPFDSKGNPND